MAAGKEAATGRRASTTRSASNRKVPDRRVPTKRPSKKKQVSRFVIFFLEIAIVLAMLLVVLKVFQMTEQNEGYNKYQYNPENENAAGGDAPTGSAGDIGAATGQNSVVNEGISDNQDMKGYINIALFGVDSTDSKTFIRGDGESPVELDETTGKYMLVYNPSTGLPASPKSAVRSDSMMIASINLETKEIKLVSLYRDTFLDVGRRKKDGSYEERYRKANNAYFIGGAANAMNMMNKNFDLNITQFVSVNYLAVMEVVDGLGGIYIDVDEAELTHINNYQETISKDMLGGKSFTRVTNTGYQLLNGLQATAYCRIRYTKGNDYKRAERQREVIKAIQDKAQQTDIVKLTEVCANVLPYVMTNIDSDQIFSLVKDVNKYKIVDEGGVPTEDKRTTCTAGQNGNIIVPLDLEKNVIWLHAFLFGTENYVPSDTVKRISATIKKDTAQYIE